MIIYPAIDLRNGQCVRLYQGDYAQQTIYDADPFARITQFVDDGAAWLHIVDLDGAKNPEQSQRALIAQLIENSTASVQIGGGIRSQQHIMQLLDHGAARVIIGSLAITAPKQVCEWLNYFGCDRIVLAFDITHNAVKQPVIATHAWQTVSQSSLFEVIDCYQSAGLKHVICTDITRDGTLTGPNHDLYRKILDKFPNLQLQASGGVHTLSDIQLLKQACIPGVIVGRALYEHKFSLGEALTC